MEMMLPAASCDVLKRNDIEAKPGCALTSYGAVHLAFQPGSKQQDFRTMANNFLNLTLRC